MKVEKIHHVALICSDFRYPEARGLRHLAFEVEDIDQAPIEDFEKENSPVEPIPVDELTGKGMLFL
ncbi:hypothetical protein [Bacillus sp. SD075]|uniref:hypothetical protein n=1 Tax=Bacillus sp. SD075 TaxID=2781732 RepID=UPI002867E5F3|nr:hypothetical protein [Bacillus sp. SD075]